MTIAEPVKDVFNGQEVEVWPRVTWSPKWALIFKDVTEKVNNKCSVTQRSTLVVNGTKVSLDGLNFDGTLIINAADGAEVVLLNFIPLIYTNYYCYLSTLVLLYTNFIFCGIDIILVVVAG